jgi:DhnA family fructose-bisphosphate aldolase class Ia
MFNASSGRCINIAMDLGIFGARSFSNGIENLPEAFATIVGANPDVIQVNPGGFRTLKDAGLADSITVALRLDVTNVYEARRVTKAWDTAHANTLEDAHHPSVGAVVLNLLELDANAELQEQCIQNIQEIGALARQRGISLMVEPLVMTTNPEGGSSSVGDVDAIATLVRQAVELGADIIKVDPVDPMTSFGEVVQIATPIPVLVRGGGKVTTRELLERTKTAMEVGARGVVYGRNVVQHPHPASLIAALAAIVHSNASVDDALALVKESA